MDIMWVRVGAGLAAIQAHEEAAPRTGDFAFAVSEVVLGYAFNDSVRLTNGVERLRTLTAPSDDSVNVTIQPPTATATAS
jgi:hypothetical protein